MAVAKGYSPDWIGFNEQTVANGEGGIQNRAKIESIFDFIVDDVSS